MKRPENESDPTPDANARDARFAVVDRLHANAIDVDEDEALAEFQEVVKEVRRERAGQQRDADLAAEQPAPAEAVEMGGEAPCQLPRFWDVEE
jgi:hypothetical protein